MRHLPAADRNRQPEQDTDRASRPTNRAFRPAWHQQSIEFPEAQTASLGGCLEGPPVLLTHSLRRAIAACASVLLVLGLVGLASSPSQADGGLSTVKGELKSPNQTFDISPVTVRFYRATGEFDSPWVLAATTQTYPQGGDSHTRFEYSVQLADGTYRATINEIDDGTAAWGAWAPTNWASWDGTDQFVVNGANVSLWYTQLEFRGGTITGKVTDQCGGNIRSPGLRVYDANQPSAPSVYEVWGETDGTYSIRGLVGPTKLKVGYPEAWYGGGESFAAATTIEVEPGGLSTGRDISTRRPLDLTPGRTQTYGGKVTTPDGQNIAGIAVRYYRHTDDNANPLVLEKTVYTNSYGFSADLPPGEYRVSFNEINDGTSASGAWQSRWSPANPANFTCLDAGISVYPTVQMSHSGGPITGRITDARGNPITGASVQAYDASGTTAATPEPSTSTLTNANGEYTAHALSGSTKLRFSKTGYNAAEWYDNATTFGTATSLTVPIGDTSAGHDVVLADAQMTSTRAPDISGTPNYGRTVSRVAGRYSPYPVKLTYQWMRRSSTLTPITGERSTTYKVRTTDIGKRLVLRETATPVGNYPGVKPVTRYSADTERVKRNTTLSTRAWYSSGTIKVRITVKVAGIAHPKGTVVVRLQAYKSNGYRGSLKSKTVTFRDGKATVSFKGSRGTYSWNAKYAGTTTVASAGKSGFGSLF